MALGQTGTYDNNWLLFLDVIYDMRLRNEKYAYIKGLLSQNLK